MHFDCVGLRKTGVAAEAYGIFPVNFCAKWLLWNVRVHFDCVGSKKRWPVNFHAKRLLWHVHVHFDDDASGISLVNFRTKWFLWHVHVHFDCAGSHETGVAVLVSCVLSYTLGLVVCPCALRPLLASLRRDLAKKPTWRSWPRDLPQGSCQPNSGQETTNRDLVQRPGKESRDLAQRCCLESFNRDLFEVPHRDLLWKSVVERSLQESCQETSYRYLARSPLMETLYREIAWRFVAEILPRCLLHKSCQESFFRELVQRSHGEISHEISYRDLAKEVSPRDLKKRSVQRELLYRALVHRSCQETSCGDLVERPGEESGGLPRGSFVDSLNRDLTLRSLTKIFCGAFV